MMAEEIFLFFFLVSVAGRDMLEEEA